MCLYADRKGRKFRFFRSEKARFLFPKGVADPSVRFVGLKTSHKSNEDLCIGQGGLDG